MKEKASSQTTTFTAVLQRFGEMGDKTGWTFIVVPAEAAEEIAPGNRRSFRVQGSLDNHPIRQVAIMPRKEGGFLLAVNAEMRKGINKPVGEKIDVCLSPDRQELQPPAALLEALAEMPEAEAHYRSLSQAERHYFTRWIDSAKGEATKTKRITQTMLALESGLQFGPMLRKIKADKDLLQG